MASTDPSTSPGGQRSKVKAGVTVGGGVLTFFFLEQVKSKSLKAEPQCEWIEVPLSINR